ncbi:MAG: hypothetical protein K2K63_00715 [Acetatifactor sp.]|nr:hypothetical protein [Acetatifactor sp.]
MRRKIFWGSDRMCVQIYDSGTQKVKQHILTPEVPGYEEYRIISAGLTPDGEIPSAFCSGEEGILYCVAGDSLFRWDVETNDMEELFRLHANGVEIGISSCLIPAGGKRASLRHVRHDS